MKIDYYETKKHGWVLIQQSGKEISVWVDPYEDGEPSMIECIEDGYFQEIYTGIDISDMPFDFKTEKNAYEYLTKKFGNLKLLNI